MAAYNFKNEIGNKYGYLTVIERAPNDSSGRAMWKCKCDCGNEVIVSGKHLRSGNTKSCGCYQKKRATESNLERAGSLVGQKFGKLLVLKEVGFKTKANGRKSRLYECLCDCGNYCIAEHVYLAYGDTKSCGCLRSKGEFQIEQLLKENNINYKKEYIFEDLVDILPLRFDFAIFDNENNLCGLIEFQGEQHFQNSNGFYSEDLIRHDKMKKEYCLKNNIKLIEIFYKRNYDLKLDDLRLEELYGL